MYFLFVAAFAAGQQAQADTLIRIDFGGTRPATGYVETKAAATDSAFGSKAPDSWVGLTLSGSTLTGTDMPNTDGSASTVDLTTRVPGPLTPKDRWWEHTASSWLFDMAMLAVLSVGYVSFVRWKIRLKSAR